MLLLREDFSAEPESFEPRLDSHDDLRPSFFSDNLCLSSGGGCFCGVTRGFGVGVGACTGCACATAVDFGSLIDGNGGFEAPFV